MTEQEARRNQLDSRDRLINDLMERSIRDNETIRLLSDMLDASMRQVDYYRTLSERKRKRWML